MEVFKTGGEYTANAISEQIGLSRQTVMKAIQFFVDKGIVVSTGKGDSTSIGGKRPELFSLAFDKFLLCIEIWPCHLRFVLLDLRFNMIDQLLLKQRLPADSGHLLSTVGMCLSHASKFDVIIEYFIKTGNYKDIFEVNEVLYKFDQQMLGV